VHLNAIFEFAIRKRWCHANPCKLVDKPASVADDDAEIRFLDQAELDALLAAPAPRRHSRRTLERAAEARALRDEERMQWKGIGEALGCSPATAVYLYRATSENAADEDLWQVDLAMYLTAAMTGLRQGELLALRWRDVDWPARKIRISGGKRRTPKSATSSRAVPMADRVGGALDRLFQASAYQGDDDLVFGHPHSGRPLDRSQVSKRFKRSLQPAGVREVRFHDLRHTFGTRMAAAGVPIRTLQAWMGHADIKVDAAEMRTFGDEQGWPQGSAATRFAVKTGIRRPSPLPRTVSGVSATRAATALSRFVEGGGHRGSGLRAVASLTATGISKTSPLR
jgi:integrase